MTSVLPLSAFTKMALFEDSFSLMWHISFFSQFVLVHYGVRVFVFSRGKLTYRCFCFEGKGCDPVFGCKVEMVFEAFVEDI